VEAQVIFPSIRARRPDLERELDELEREQRRLLFQLDAVCSSALASDAGTLSGALANFREALGRHERGAEALLDHADGDGASASGTSPPPGPDRPTRPR
jgi:hypothetical protein